MGIAQECDAIISMGTSAVLGDYSVGDVVLSREFVEYDMDVSGIGIKHGITPFTEMSSPIITTEEVPLLESAVMASLLKRGVTTGYVRSMSGDTFLCNKQLVNSLKETFQADIADMESAAIAKLCRYSLKKPMCALRYISDRADDDSSTVWREEVKKASVLFNSLVKHIAQHHLT